MNFSGGRKIFFEYAKFLRNKGHNVAVLCKNKKGALIDFIKVDFVKEFNAETIPKCDLIVATTPNDVKSAVESKIAHVVHFCQGYEISVFEQRIYDNIIPPRFMGNSLLKKLRLWRKKKSWKKKIAKLNKIYSLDTTLITVSKHLKEKLESRYTKKVYVCRNGVHHKFFYPNKDWEAPKINLNQPLKVASIGSYGVSCKGLPVTFQAIDIIKKHGIPVHFIRITPKACKEDYNSDIVDIVHEQVNHETLGNILRECDVYISNSSEGEGFGLPAMEALSCGLIAVFSEISSYINFSDAKDFCLFVPENDTDSTVKAIKKILSYSPEEWNLQRERGLKTAAAFSHDKACQNFETILTDLTKKLTV